MEINWKSNKNQILKSEDGQLIPIIPTIVVDVHNNVLGLAYSSEASLAEAIQTEKGVYYSRTRKEIWRKSPSEKNSQTLLSVELDCDGDALLFRVKQRGDFCHEKRLSCFQPFCQLSGNTDKLRIGIPSGHSEAAAVELLERIGISIYRTTVLRTNKFLVKSYLHPNVEAISLKPADLDNFLTNGFVDMIVCFDDVIPKALESEEVSKTYPIQIADSRSTQIVLASSKLLDFSQKLTILSEYPELTQNWLNARHIEARIISCNGNAEQLVAQGLGDAAVAVMNSGDTLKRNNLSIVETLQVSKLGVFWKNDKYLQSPRFFAAIKNSLKSDSIYFYTVDGPYGFMSNFYYSPTGRWMTSEHYYQAHKFARDQTVSYNGREYLARNLIANQPTAKSCYKLSWRFSDFYRSDWESPVPEQYNAPCEGMQIKDKVMWKALSIKFSQPHLLEKLRATGDKTLIEHALRDSHFGCGIDGNGKNMLGKLLMAGRSKGFRSDLIKGQLSSYHQTN